jgi:hypothetical protein
MRLNFPNELVEVFMTHKNRIVFRPAAFLGILFFLSIVAAKPLDAGDDDSLMNSSSSPSRQGLELVSFFGLFVQNRIIGGLAVYDDPTTSRRVDCMALYDTGGELLMFGWFDRFGIERVAADRGFLEGNNALEGVFVVLLNGDSV